MFDAQTSALAGHIGGRYPALRRPVGAARQPYLFQSAHGGLRPLPGGHRPPLQKVSAISVSTPVWNLCASVFICGPNLGFKIKRPSRTVQKIGKPKQGEARVFCPKKFAIFLRANFSEYRAIAEKTVEKTIQNSAKKTRFL